MAWGAAVASLMTVMDAARAADAIYSNADFEGYTQLGGFFDPKNKDALAIGDQNAGGGSGGVYRFNKGAGQYMLSFRGTVMGSKDMYVDDVQAAFEFRVDRAADCIAYAQQVKSQYPGAIILVTGHSLGGFLAQVVGVECDLPFITFNASPASRALVNTPAAYGYRTGVNLRVKWDPGASMAAGRHIGPVVTIPHYGINILNAHKMSAMLVSLERSEFRDTGAIPFISRQNM